MLFYLETDPDELVGQWHGLSAPKRGHALKVRPDFMLFCGLDLQGSVPDATHIKAPRDRGEEGAKDDPDLHCSADEDARRVKKGAGAQPMPARPGERL